MSDDASRRTRIFYYIKDIYNLISSIQRIISFRYVLPISNEQKDQITIQTRQIKKIERCYIYMHTL